MREILRRVLSPGLLTAGIISALMVLSVARAADPGWSAVGNVAAPAWDGHELVFRGDTALLSIRPLSDDVIRIHLTTAKTFGRDHSYAVVNRDPGTPAARATIGSNVTELATGSLIVRIQHAPLRISIADRAGQILDADDPGRGIAVAGGAFRVAKQLRDDEHLYGFGEKIGPLDKRGWKLGGYNFAMWNSDTFAYDSGTDPLYVSVPFYLVLRNGQAHGLLLDNTWRSTFDLGRERPDLLTFGADGGDLDYYFINGPEPKKVVERYTSLTGRMPLPPMWALGYHQCRYSYYPESRVRLLADTFRSKRVPADVIWLDIHYQDNFKPFTWDHQRFPDPAKMIGDLGAQGFKIVCIVDPHPKKEKGYSPYDSGIAGDHFVKWPNGTVYEAPVWPSQAEHNPGPSVFPDFSRPATREWWGSLYADFLKMGVAGIWNDMDEPAVFDTPTGTMPLDIVFDNDGQPTSHREIHNVYGQLMSRSTFEGLSRLRPNDRPFVLTRATFAGGQRYAAVWPGDNTSDWSSLRQSIPMLLNLGLSGFTFVGCDIGGFAGTPTGELFARWLQLGVFYPFMRAHTTWGTPDQEPWSYGVRYEAINKRTIELRYELLPYIYTAMHEAAETGVPALRPLFLEFPQDGYAAGLNDEFLFGADLLVAPVLWERATERDVYLPRGDWYDYWTGERFEGGKSIRVKVGPESLPLFVRAGGFVFRQPVVQDTGEMPGQPLRVLVAAAQQSARSLYEDDGKSLDYRTGASATRELRQARDGQGRSIDVSAPEGSFRPRHEWWSFEVLGSREPKSVSIRHGTESGAGERVDRADTEAQRVKPQWWSYENGILTIRTEDRNERLRISIED